MDGSGKALAMNEDCFVRQYSNNGWTFRFFLEDGGTGAGFDGAAQIYRDDVMHSCIVSPCQSLSREQVLQWLMHLCTDWVDDWTIRRREAETLPAAL